MVNERRLRLLESRQGLPVILWAALLINAPLPIIFTYIFSVKNLLVHMVFVAEGYPVATQSTHRMCLLCHFSDLLTF